MSKQPTLFAKLIHLLLFVTLLAGLWPGVAAADTDALPNRRYLPAVTNYACARVKTATLFGVQHDDTRGGTSPYFMPLLNSGASWVRTMVRWEAIQPTNVTPSKYNWAQTDKLLSSAQLPCTYVIATIDVAPEWAAPGLRAPIYASQVGRFSDFLKALVERYDGDGIDDAPGHIVVNYWELYNEPDYGPGFDGGGWGLYGSTAPKGGISYATLLKTAYPVIKKANPNAKVLFGGIAHDWFRENGGIFVRSFLDDVLKAGGGAYFDYMNIHYYPHNAQNWTQTNSIGLAEKLDQVHEILNKRFVDKPFMVTEAGWHSDNDDHLPSSPEEQSRYVIPLYVQARAKGVEVLVWWMLHDPDSDGYPYETGLMTNSEPPVLKPAYAVYQTAAARLSKAEYSAALSVAETQDPDLEAYRFVDTATHKTFYVAWLDPIKPVTVGEEPHEPLVVSGGQAMIFDKNNVQIAVIRDGDDGAADGKVTIQVTGSPVFIVID